MIEAGSTQPEEAPVKPKRREARFNMAEILADYNIPSRIQQFEENGRKYNPNGTKRHLTIAKVDKMMRGKHMP